MNMIEDLFFFAMAIFMILVYAATLLRVLAEIALLIEGMR